jgi:hypothetical protein
MHASLTLKIFLPLVISFSHHLIANANNHSLARVYDQVEEDRVEEDKVEATELKKTKLKTDRVEDRQS